MVPACIYKGYKRDIFYAEIRKTSCVGGEYGKGPYSRSYISFFLTEVRATAIAAYNTIRSAENEIENRSGCQSSAN